MEKMKTIAFVVVLLGSVVSYGTEGAATPSPFRISKDADTIIVVAPEKKGSVASYNRMYAARELARYLQRITGVEAPIATDVDQAKLDAGGVIFVGPSNHTDALRLGRNEYDFGAGGFLIKCTPKYLALLGDDSDYGSKIGGREFGETGTYYATATFLEKYCGVRWLWPGELGTVVPVKDAIIVPAVEFRSHPAYYCRVNRPPLETSRQRPDGSWVSFKGDHFREWSVFQRRHRMGASTYMRVGHYGEAYVKASDFEEHPEYFSLIEGKRKPWGEKYGGQAAVGQVCQANSNVVALFAKKMVARAKNSKNGKPLFSLTCNDGGFFCMCPNCKSMDGEIPPWPKDAAGGRLPGKQYNEKNGWASDLSNRIWKFNNQVAREVASEDPSVLLSGLAYAMYVNPPSEVRKIEDNIIVGICDTHLAVGGPEEYKKGKDVFLEWAKKARNLGVRGYYYSVGGTRPHRIAETFRFLYNLGCRYHIAEAKRTYGFNWIEYLINKKAQWNPFLDVDSVINDYYQAAYGPGAPAMKRLLKLQEEISMGYNVMNSYRHPNVLPEHWTKDARNKWRALLDEAIAKTKGTDYEARVRFSEPAWEMLDSYCELVASLSKLKAMGISVPPGIRSTATLQATQSEISDEISNAHAQWKRFKDVTDEHVRRESWSIPAAKYLYDYNITSALGKTVENLHEVVNANAMILPAVWKFKIDPESKGMEEGWSKPDFNDKDWSEIRVDDFWEKQGYGAEAFPANGSDGYNGTAWYRLSVDIPEERNGSEVWLELGAVDESGDAWVNGRHVWEFRFDSKKDAAAWMKPKRFNITDAVKFGETNSLVVKVEDSGGMGGIWKPCFVHFGNKSASSEIDRPLINGDGIGQGWRFSGKNITTKLETKPDSESKKMVPCVHVACDEPFKLEFAGELDFKKNDMYRLNLEIRGEPTQDDKLNIRVMYLNVVEGEIVNRHYSWFDVNVDAKWKSKNVVVPSPTPDKIWNKVNVTFFFKPGRYDIKNTDFKSE